MHEKWSRSGNLPRLDLGLQMYLTFLLYLSQCPQVCAELVFALTSLQRWL